jgi:GTP-binding protein
MRAQKLQDKAEKLEKRATHHAERISLEQFFDSDQKVGETRVLREPGLDDDEWDLDEMPADVRADFEMQRQQVEQLRKDHQASASEVEMALGLSQYRPVDRRATHKEATTVALAKLASTGKLELSDLSDLDYDALKSFALEHELKMEDFFTRTKTADGIVTEFSSKLRMPAEEGEEEAFDSDQLIEHSKEYLRTRRRSTTSFRDRIRIRCMAGSGGKGGVSFYRDTRIERGPPDGGDGGDGGSVIFIAADNKKPSLASLQPSYRATSGMPGSRTRRKGKSGNDVVIEVPLGTTITEFRSGTKGEDSEELIQREDPLTPPSPAQTFMTPENNFRGPSKPRDGQETSNEEDNAPVDLDALGAEERIWQIEQAHKRLYADPREGRPWAPPELPEDHPLKEGASEFHRMISSYEHSSSLLNAEHGTTAEEMLAAAAHAKQKPGQSPSRSFMASTSSSKGNATGKVKARAGSVVAALPNMEQYAMEEGEMGFDEYDLQSEDSGADSFVSGTDLVDKYRLQPPGSGEDDQGARVSNLPRSVDLDEPGAYFVAAKGGAGGLGNFRLGAVRNRPQAVSTPGKPGESLIYQLELKLIADVGLVGFPNAGKSTFLSSVSRANPKIASYPFTTLSPEIGTIQLDDDPSEFVRGKKGAMTSQFTIADLPGLIEGAHANRGLGHSFLKHIERTSVLAYVIDMSGGDNRDPWKSFNTLWDELELYQKGLVKRPSIIIANKMDAGSVAHENLKAFAKRLKADKTFKNLKIYPISAASKMNMLSVINGLRQLLGISPPDHFSKTSRKEREREAVLQKRVNQANQAGIFTINAGAHLSEAMRNIK